MKDNMLEKFKVELNRSFIYLVGIVMPMIFLIMLNVWYFVPIIFLTIFKYKEQIKSKTKLFFKGDYNIDKVNIFSSLMVIIFNGFLAGWIFGLLSGIYFLAVSVEPIIKFTEMSDDEFDMADKHVKNMIEKDKDGLDISLELKELSKIHSL